MLQKKQKTVHIPVLENKTVGFYKGFYFYNLDIVAVDNFNQALFI